jgi:ferrous iron transport protein A
MSIVSLRRMTVGQAGTVARVKGGDAIGARIREMGLVPGAEIQIVGRAPLNDPVRIKLQGHDLTLRNNEADHILVKVAAAGEDGP